MKIFTFKNRKFFADQFGSVYEMHETEHLFYCALLGRSPRDAVIDAMSGEDNFDYRAADEYQKEIRT